jgi:hypothetical protein
LTFSNFWRSIRPGLGRVLYGVLVTGFFGGIPAAIVFAPGDLFKGFAIAAALGGALGLLYHYGYASADDMWRRRDDFERELRIKNEDDRRKRS